MSTGYNVDLMRDLMFILESRQTSPRMTIVLSIEDEAREIGCVPGEIAHNLDVLQNLEFIEGPGADVPGFWLFRRLTLKGNQFIRATRRSGDWERIKQHYERHAQNAS